MTAVIETLNLLLRKTGENGHDIALIFPEESGDFIRGYAAGQIDALRLALEHARDIAGQAGAGIGSKNHAPDHTGQKEHEDGEAENLS